MSVSAGTKEAQRTARAANEHITYYIIDSNTHAIEGDSGNTHVIEVDGSKATDCSCPDREHQGVRCKHMAAYDEWLIDEVVMSSGIEVSLADSAPEL